MKHRLPLIRTLACAVLTVLAVAGCEPVERGSDGTGGTDRVDTGSNGSNGSKGSNGGASSSPTSPVTGSGHLTTRHLDLSGVTSVLVEAHFDVRIVIGEPEQATVHMDDNLTELVDTTVTGDHLRLGIASDAGVRDATLTAEITIRDLDRLTVAGAGQVRFDDVVRGQVLRLDASGASRITGPVNVGQLDVLAAGVSGVTLSGQAEQLNLTGSGTVGLDLGDLMVRHAEAELSGTSTATVGVRDTLAARTNGVSRLRYIGDPQIVREQSTGLSSIGAVDR